MMRRPAIPPAVPRRCATLLLTLIALLAVAVGSARANTQLTNGSAIPVSKPFALLFNTIFNGDEGYSIFVPPGAELLEVRFETEPNSPFELMVRRGLDIGINPQSGFPTAGNKAADFRTFSDNLGRAVIVIEPVSHPPLESGTYFIGFITKGESVKIEGSLTATVGGGPIETLFTVVESTFDSDAEGWSKTPGHRDSTIEYAAEDGNPGGWLRLRSIPWAPPEYFLASDEFLIDLLDQPDGRIEFDLARINGDSVSNFNVEVIVTGADGAWKYIGGPPPPIPTEFDFFDDRVNPIWWTFSAPVNKDLWYKSAGDAGKGTFEEVFSAPTSIEIRATFVITGGNVGLDNVRIRARGQAPPQDVLPTTTSFSGGFDRWTRNYPADKSFPEANVGNPDSKLLWSEFEGNPGGSLRLQEAGARGSPEIDAFVAPQEYLGIYTNLSGPRFEFDFKHKSFAGTQRPVSIQIYGAGSIYEWQGVTPINLWSHQTAPLTESAWTRTSGTAPFADVLANITRIELNAEYSDGVEWNELDNFALLDDNTPPQPQEILISDDELTFSGVATGPDPEEQTVELTSSGGSLPWESEVTGEMADRVTLSETGGMTPVEIGIQVGIEGLAEGEYSFEVAFRAQGTNIEPAVVAVRVSIAPQPVPTPVISDNGVVNVATYETRMAPGSLGAIFGENLGGPAAGWHTSYTGRRGDSLPTEVNGIRVLVYAVFGSLIGEAPLSYVGDKQINFQMPFEVFGNSFVNIVVANGGAKSDGQQVQLTSQAPGIFTFGSNRAAATNNDGKLNTDKSSQPRLQPMTLYVTGQGNTAPSWQTGRAATAYPLIHAPTTAAVYIGGVKAKITFLGLAPGLVGVLQVNLIPKWSTPVGDQPIVIDLGGFASNKATVTIR